MKRLGIKTSGEFQDLLFGECVLPQAEGRRLQVLPVEVVTVADPDEVTVAGSVAGTAGVGVVVASVVIAHGLHGRAALGPDKQSVQTNNCGARSGAWSIRCHSACGSAASYGDHDRVRRGPVGPSV